MNFATDVLEAAPAGERALVEISRDGRPEEWRLRRGRARREPPGGARCTPRASSAATWCDARRQPLRSGCWRWSRASARAGRAARATSSCAPRTSSCACGSRSRDWSSATSATPRCSRTPAGPGRRGRPVGRAARRAGAARRRPRPRRPVPDHVHFRHRERAEGGPARAALPRRPDGAGAPLARRPAPATSSGAPRRRAGRSRRATCSSPRGCAAPPRSFTTRASTHTSGSSCSTASASTSSAWRRPSTARSPSARRSRG